METRPIRKRPCVVSVDGIKPSTEESFFANYLVYGSSYTEIINIIEDYIGTENINTIEIFPVDAPGELIQINDQTADVIKCGEYNPKTKREDFYDTF